MTCMHEPVYNKDALHMVLLSYIDTTLHWLYSGRPLKN